MSKKLDCSPTTGESDSFEVIETAIDNLDLLTRAFDVIAEVCDELNHAEGRRYPERHKIVMH